MSDANDPETWLAYYLPDMDDAKEINRRKRKRAQMIAQGMMVTADEEDHDKVIPYTLQRDYTYSTNPCPALSQLVFTFRDDADNNRQKSAFYNTTQSKLMLRKKRVKVLLRAILLVSLMLLLFSYFVLTDAFMLCSNSAMRTMTHQLLISTPSLV